MLHTDQDRHGGGAGCGGGGGGQCGRGGKVRGAGGSYKTIYFHFLGYRLFITFFLFFRHDICRAPNKCDTLGKCVY